MKKRIRTTVIIVGLALSSIAMAQVSTSTQHPAKTTAKTAGFMESSAFGIPIFPGATTPGTYFEGTIQPGGNSKNFIRLAPPYERHAADGAIEESSREMNLPLRSTPAKEPSTRR